MAKFKDGRSLSKQERIAEQMQQFTNYTRIMFIQDRSTKLTTIDEYSLSNFTELCRAIISSSSLLHIEVQTRLDVQYLNELHSCLRDNKTVISLKFSEPAYKPEIPSNVNKFFQRNLALPKIVKFITETFKSKDSDIHLKDINLKDYGFLKYCLPSNQGAIEKGLKSANFTGTYNWNQLVHEQFAYNLICKNITKYGGSFSTLPSEVHNQIFGFLDDCGVPCIGKQYVVSDV